MSKIFIECSRHSREEIKPVAINRTKVSESITLFKFLVPMTYQSGYNTLCLLAADEIPFLLVFDSSDESFSETYQNCVCSFGDEYGSKQWVYITANRL